MPLLGVLILMSIGMVFVLMAFYIAIVGRLGFQFFKYNFPLSKKRGTHYLILEKSGRFKWIYGKFKSVWQWPDKTKSYIGKNFDRMSQTAEPLVFLMEGFPTNAMLANQLPPEQMSRLVNNIITEVEIASRFEAEVSDKKALVYERVLPILTLVFAAIAALVGLAMIMGLNDISEQVTWISDSLKEFKPFIPEVLEALKNGPRQL